jgi:hypothetical protein
MGSRLVHRGSLLIPAPLIGTKFAIFAPPRGRRRTNHLAHAEIWCECPQTTHRRHSFGTDRFSRRKRQLLTAIAGQQAWRLRTPYFDFAVAGLTVGVTAPS